jgi:hypothetical protein
MNRTTQPIFVLKRRAKELVRTEGIPLHEAQNRIAIGEGHSSWSHLTSRKGVKPEEPIITKLPVSPATRAEAIELANNTFERVLERIEPDNPAMTRALWNAADYVDQKWLDESVLPIDRDYALSLIEAFLVHHVIGFATQADREAASKRRP